VTKIPCVDPVALLIVFWRYAMKEQIASLNRQFVDGKITADEYREETRKLLKPVNWLHRIQFENMLFISYVD